MVRKEREKRRKGWKNVAIYTLIAITCDASWHEPLVLGGSIRLIIGLSSNEFRQLGASIIDAADDGEGRQVNVPSLSIADHGADKDICHAD